ncbi:MAG: cell division protein FtsZ [Deltaproteobacteria bacterium]|nr:cell division protein FtsZ [Deltaproteobacteria bacterium]MBW2118594.1 cell division protein FtsZ [Deltaproteobacteria bacterium]MBW2344357.1 cell division protein FtsZ [Deltaproteobacteria bacterium]
MKFEIVDEKKKYDARIKVIGAGGAGGNAINNMINSKLRGVDFIVSNTDCQDLDRSECSYKIQLGPSVTMGLGAGADPEIGEKSAEESVNEIREAVAESDMVFIAAGMGGGTGTGACPVIAREAKESGALTVAVVTKPFNFEGEKRMKRATEGIEKLKAEVDSLIVIPNERLKTLGSKTTTFKDLIMRADEVLLQAVKGISDLIISNGFISLDFADVKKVMEQMGTAIMGMGTASGENRGLEAAQMAINSPLLEDISINGAKGVLMNIAGPADMTMDEIDAASNFIKEEVNKDAEIIWGVVLDDAMEDEIRITVIATGIGGNGDSYRQPHVYNNDYLNVVNIRDADNEDTEEDWTVRMNGVCLDTPTFQRKNEGLLASMNNTEAKKEKKSFFNKFRLKDNLDYPTFLRAKAD